jgi:cytoskeleton protein RodZ
MSGDMPEHLRPDLHRSDPPRSDQLTPEKLKPGQLLAKARLERGLTLADVAKTTRIVVARLQALERDDYEQAGVVSAYVTGYVRAYAKAVGLVEAPLVQAIEAHFAATAERQAQLAPPAPSHKPLPWMLILATCLALAAFIGLGQWVWRQMDKAQPHFSVPSGYSGDAMAPPARSTDAPSDLPPPSASDYPTAAEAATLEEPMTAVEVLASSEANTSTASRAEANLAPVDPLVAQAVSKGEGPDLLSLVFQNDCWFEVYDAAGNKLDSYLAVAGTALTLRGLAPFAVKLGNPGAVSLSVNGRQVPLEATGRVLRLQVGP